MHMRNYQKHAVCQSATALYYTKLNNTFDTFKRNIINLTYLKGFSTAFDWFKIFRLIQKEKTCLLLIGSIKTNTLIIIFSLLWCVHQVWIWHIIGVIMTAAGVIINFSGVIITISDALINFPYPIITISGSILNFSD